MSLEQHVNPKVRYQQQVDNSKAYVLPFIAVHTEIGKQTNVLEVGTGEGGVLKPFLDKGAFCVGVDLNDIRIVLAREYLADELEQGQVVLQTKNIYDDDFKAQYLGFFDVIILKDVIEHVPEQESFIPYLATLLAPGGQIFFGFPPWYMPFGGHQQLCHNKWASKLPWYHILPRPMYHSILKWAGESEGTIQELLEIYDTRISIERFERIIRRSGLQILKRQAYLINPIYRYKFGLKPRKQWKPLTWLPFFRNFVTTCMYYSVGAK
ncbi:class I SAM-dependent methyltransferase [Taibaiella koreensis]|uniref:class I SAM-dependent methyltransferase n=1 Tax=Taibaiella koreensis TaxID=1268548 RepID=UPI000E59D12E|nr:class I SAM-dependent methyltransferase [Taibaiella koreensis]